MNTPNHLFYTKDHEWIHIHDDGTATIGITDFAQSELGDIVFVELNDIGDECEKEDTFGTVEAVKPYPTFMPLWMVRSLKSTKPLKMSLN